jgi:hypothetical protein
MEVWQFSMAITVRARGKHANGWKYSKEKRYRKLRTKCTEKQGNYIGKVR